MKGRSCGGRRFSLQPLCVVPSPTSEDEPAPDDDHPGLAGLGHSGHRRNSRTLAHDERSSAARSSSPAAKSHYKVVVLGSARVGKSSLVCQFLFATFSPRYRPTVDDMHSVELDCNGLNLRLDILDTGGSYAFPAMRALAINSSDGFLLVCAVDDPSSLEEVESLRAQIIEAKGPSVPIVVVVNKTDLICDDGEPSPNPAKSDLLCLEMVESLVTCDWGHGFVAASAKTNNNIVEVFQELFVQAKSRISLSPAVRKRRQSLPARAFLPNTSQLSHLHNLSLQNAIPPPHKTTIKRNSCTVS